MRFRNLKELFGLIYSCIILLTTQTRAAIFTIVPAIMASHLLFARLHHKYYRISSIVGIVIAIGVGYWLLNDFILGKFTYIGRNIIEYDLHRFEVNWIMSIGVLKESPLFGISPDIAWDIYYRYGGLPYYNPLADTPTHHNQLGFYLRYYGLIGVGFFCWLYILIFRKIIRARSFWISFVLGSIFIFDIVYSMSHNNKLLASPLLWIFLSLASIDPEHEEAPYQNA